MTSAAEQNLVRRSVPKLLTLGPRDPRIGDRPSPWGRGGRREGFRGLHSPQINQPSASRPEVQPQKAITALGTLNLDRLHSFSADSWDKDTGSCSPPVQRKHVFFFFSKRIYVHRETDYAKPQWKTLIWMKATEVYLLYNSDESLCQHTLWCPQMLIMSGNEMREKFCTSKDEWGNSLKP